MPCRCQTAPGTQHWKHCQGISHWHRGLTETSELRDESPSAVAPREELELISEFDGAAMLKRVTVQDVGHDRICSNFFSSQKKKKKNLKNKINLKKKKKKKKKQLIFVFFLRAESYFNSEAALSVFYLCIIMSKNPIYWLAPSNKMQNLLIRLWHFDKLAVLFHLFVVYLMKKVVLNLHI